jgi:hypothetical protein
MNNCQNERYQTTLREVKLHISGIQDGYMQYERKQIGGLITDGGELLTYLKSAALKPLTFRSCEHRGMCWQYFNPLPRSLAAGINVCILEMDPKVGYESYDWLPVKEAEEVQRRALR